MLLGFDGYSGTTDFPDHDLCFGSSNSSSICQIPSAIMISFLNISTPDAYLDVYCNNPPLDSCAFGYCPNPDVASPAVRYSTYFSSLVSAILVLYSPGDVTSAFFAQLLNVYSLIVAAIISIVGHNLTKMHSVIALTLAASPLSLYLLMYVFRSLLGKQTRLQAVFGPGMYLNRALVLIMLPLWAAVLSFTALPTSVWHFQQAACDTTVAGNHVATLFFIPFVLFFAAYPQVGIIVVLAVAATWGIAIWRLRKIIWGKKDGRKLPLGRLWRKVVNRYPFIQFCSVIILPHAWWMVNVEVGLKLLSTREKFSATYGQLLAIFVTVPPFIQLCVLLPRLPRWFADLTWVRLLTCRRNKPFLGVRLSDESALPMQDTTRAALLDQKLEGLPAGQATLQMHPMKVPYVGSRSTDSTPSHSRSTSYK
ncbi:hypothetical protein C8R43DRAFT_584180 [Mycena crocata]|nr:hypothetical protein C8R43DRAFT_584180 [Mycena crocata]